MNDIVPFGIEKSLLQTYSDDISRFVILNRDEEAELGKRILNGDREAINRLVESNLKFVMSVAKRFKPIGAIHKMDYLDLISHGNFGLIRAAETFDYRKGFKFISYAKQWIVFYILDAIRANGLVRLPANVQNTSSNFIQDKAKAIQKETGEDLETVSKQVVDSYKIKYASLDQSVILNGKDGGENKLTLDRSQYLVDKKSIDFMYDLENKQNINKLEEAISQLDPKDQKVLKYMFYAPTVNGRRNKTKTGKAKVIMNNGYREVAMKMGISHERVRQLKERGLKKLRVILDPDKTKTVDTVFG